MNRNISGYKPPQLTGLLLEFDWLATGYLSLTGLFFLFYAFEGVQYLQFGVIHWIIITLIYWLGTRKPLPHPMQILRFCYPVILLMLIYYEVYMLSQLIYESNAHFDTLILDWEAMLFGGHPHRYWFQLLDGRLWAEFFHLMYLAYYPLLIGSYLYVWGWRPYDLNRFAFVYLGIFITFTLFFAVFPVHGPVAFRDVHLNDAGFFSRVVDFLFVIGESPGGAFPSSHVGQSVGIFFLLRPLNKNISLLIWAIILGIGLGMIYGSIHYTLDAITGLLAGWLLYLVWNKVYSLVSTEQYSCVYKQKQAVDETIT